MKRRRITWGIVLLVLGTIMLLDNLNIFDFLGVSIWSLIWPLGLIVFGLWILWVSRKGYGMGAPGEISEISIPVDGAEEYAVNINYGAGELVIDSHGVSEQLLHCLAEGGLNHEVKETAGEKHIKLWSPVTIQPFRFVTRRKWAVALNGDIPCKLKISTGSM